MLERAGIPTAYLTTTGFTETVMTTARAIGAIGYPFVVLEHPISNLLSDELDTRAAQALVEVERILVSPDFDLH